MLIIGDRRCCRRVSGQGNVDSYDDYVRDGERTAISLLKHGLCSDWR